MSYDVPQDARSLRDDLYRIIHHYAELSRMAQKGEVDPIGQIGRILEKTVPYLLIIIRDLLPYLEKRDITYHEALYHVIRAAQLFPDQESLLESRQEIQRIEADSRVFLYAVKWLDIQLLQRPSAQEGAGIQKKLSELNNKYRKRYSEDESTTTMIPCFLPRQESESPDVNLNRVGDLVRRALLETHHLMVEHEPEKMFFVFTRTTRKEIEDDVMHLAWFLFRCGFPVDRIASGYYKDSIAAFLNEKLLDYLISIQETLNSLTGISRHLCLLSLVDFTSFYEVPGDYRPLENAREVLHQVKYLKSKNRRGASLLKKSWELHEIYGSQPYSKLAQHFLDYRYYTSNVAYHGEHRVNDKRAQMAVELYGAILDRSAVEKKAEADLEATSRGLSTKTREEMTGLVKLLMDSLYDPSKVKGKKVKVLGDISSGAMGKVSIGILKNRIVALKVVKASVSMTLGDPEGLLEYEAALNERAQSPDQHPNIVEYYGLVEQEDEKILINGYYPCDNLTQLVEKNWQMKYRPPFATESHISLATMEVIINQLLECLRVFKKRGVIHRDLKTDNILYTVDENERLNRLKVIDFGVAKAVGTNAVDDIFKGKVVGTFAYMAPEQAKSKSTFQSDLYSMGAILTVLLTGKLPMVFPKTKTRKDLLAQLVRIERESRPTLTTLNPFLKRHTTMEHVAATVERMLELDPARRPDVEECQEAFDGVFQHIGDLKDTVSIFYHRG